MDYTKYTKFDIRIPNLLLTLPDQDDSVEQEIFQPSETSTNYKVNYSQVNLRPAGTTTAKPWSSIDKSLRDQVDGITLLMLIFTAEDLKLFPRLKVSVPPSLSHLPSTPPDPTQHRPHGRRLRRRRPRRPRHAQNNP